MPKRVLQGVVVSDKNDKTIVVKVERRFTHPLLKKTVRRTKNYHAHDESNGHKVGDVVWIEEGRPMSKLKRWVVVDQAAEAAKAHAGNGWAALQFARYNARATGDGGAGKTYDEWADKKLRGFGYAGMALGLQDGK